MGGFIAASFTIKNEIFDIVIRDEFDSTAGEDGYIEIWLRNREKYGVYKLFVLYHNDSKEILTLFIREPLHGQIFSLAFINRVFSEVCECLQVKYGLSGFVLTLGVEPHTEWTGDIEKDMEILLQEEEVKLLF